MANKIRLSKELVVPSSTSILLWLLRVLDLLSSHMKDASTSIHDMREARDSLMESVVTIAPNTLCTLIELATRARPWPEYKVRATSEVARGREELRERAEHRLASESMCVLCDGV